VVIDHQHTDFGRLSHNGWHHRTEIRTATEIGRAAVVIRVPWRVG
jgi:hypothetical protein